MINNMYKCDICGEEYNIKNMYRCKNCEYNKYDNAIEIKYDNSTLFFLVCGQCAKYFKYSVDDNKPHCPNCNGELINSDWTE